MLLILRFSFHVRALLGFLILGLGLTGCSRAPATVDSVIAQNTAAMGGVAAIEAIKTLEVNLHIADPGFEVDAIYRAARPGKMRIDASSRGKHVFTEAFDGTRGWEWAGKGDGEPCSAKATAALQHGVQLPGKLFGLHEMRSLGYGVSLGAKERLEGIDYNVVHLSLPDGYSIALYVDPSNRLITRRRDVRPLHVDIDPTPTTIETKNSDFRRVNGVMFPFAGTDTDLRTGKVLEQTTVKSITVNPPLDDKIFERL